MARSIHTTRKHLKELDLQDYACADTKQDKREQIEEQLETKRTIKEMSRHTRPVQGHVTADSVRIIVETGPFLFHPASTEDIRELLGRMPDGTTAGLTAITLCLGAKYLKRTDSGEPWQVRDPDPITGRPGLEVMPGIYAASALGTYSPSKHAIWVTGYVLDPDVKRSVALEMHLRLRTLNVFMHELAHHDDWMRRMDRGRWCGASQHNSERYAERMGHEWTRKYVLPYLQERYPGQVRELQSFLSEQTGIVLPLDLLAGDQRGHAKGGLIRVAGMFPLDCRIDDVFAKVQSGADATEIRLDFAWGLHAAEHHCEAMQVVDAVLAEEPCRREALLHKSHFLCELGRYGESAAAARGVLGQDSEDIDALGCLADACEGLKDWPAVVELCTRILASSDDMARGSRRRFLGQRCRARVGAGDLAGARADIAEIRSGGRKLDESLANRLEQLVGQGLTGRA